MTATVVSCTMTLIYTAGVTVWLRCARPRRPGVAMIRAFFSSVPAWLIVYAIAAGGTMDAGRPHPSWSLVTEGAFGLLLYTAAILGGVVQVYNLADRGFSLRMLIDLLEADRSLTLEEICRGYSAGRGLRWMYGKRIEGLVQSRLVRVADGTVVCTPRGQRAARVFLRLRTILRLDPPAGRAKRTTESAAKAAQ